MGGNLWDEHYDSEDTLGTWRKSLIKPHIISLLRYYHLLNIVFILSKSSLAVKKVCSPQEGHCEKRCEIQGGGQEWL